MFDEASMSVIASGTVREVARLAGMSADVRRFRPNVVVRSLRSVPFEEDDWIGGVLSFGQAEDAPAIAVTMRDVRCSMLNLDPDSASPAPEMLKAVVRANQNNAGIYGSVTRSGWWSGNPYSSTPLVKQDKNRSWIFGVWFTLQLDRDSGFVVAAGRWVLKSLYPSLE